MIQVLIFIKIRISFWDSILTAQALVLNHNSYIWIASLLTLNTLKELWFTCDFRYEMWVSTWEYVATLAKHRLMINLFKNELYFVTVCVMMQCREFFWLHKSEIVEHSGLSYKEGTMVLHSSFLALIGFCWRNFWKEEVNFEPLRHYDVTYLFWLIVLDFPWSFRSSAAQFDDCRLLVASCLSSFWI